MSAIGWERVCVCSTQRQTRADRVESIVECCVLWLSRTKSACSVYGLTHGLNAGRCWLSLGQTMAID